MPDKKKTRKRAGLLVFLPLLSLRKQIASGSDRIADSFDAMYDAYDSGVSVAGSLTKGHKGLMDAFTTLIAESLTRGYRAGAKLTGSEHVPDFSTLAKSQALKTVTQMGNTSTKWLRSGNNDFVFSRQRAERAAKYTSAEAYANGMAKAFTESDEDFEKSWNTTSDDPCDECLSNEDEGWIPMEEDFQSGHYAPLLHPDCACYLTVRRSRG